MDHSQLLDAPSAAVRQLLTAGLNEVRDRGHDQVTMRLVAKRARVSPATAYTHFSSKNQLLAVVFLQHLRNNPPPPEAIDPARTVGERLREMTWHLAAVMASEAELTAATPRALITRDPDVRGIRHEIARTFTKCFRAAFGSSYDPAALRTLQLAFHGLLLQTGMGELEYVEVAEQMDTVISVIERDLTVHPSPQADRR